MIKMLDCDSLQNYINHFKSLMQQMVAIRSKVEEQDAVMTLLSNLPPSYENWMMIISMHSYLSMPKVLVMLLQEDNRRAGDNSSSSTSQALYAKKNKKL